MRKLLDVGKLRELGWGAKIPLARGVEMTYQSFLEEQAERSLRA